MRNDQQTLNFLIIPAILPNLTILNTITVVCIFLNYKGAVYMSIKKINFNHIEAKKQEIESIKQKITTLKEMINTTNKTLSDTKFAHECNLFSAETELQIAKKELRMIEATQETINLCKIRLYILSGLFNKLKISSSQVNQNECKVLYSEIRQIINKLNKLDPKWKSEPMVKVSKGMLEPYKNDLKPNTTKSFFNKGNNASEYRHSTRNKKNDAQKRTIRH